MGFQSPTLQEPSRIQLPLGWLPVLKPLVCGLCFSDESSRQCESRAPDGENRGRRGQPNTHQVVGAGPCGPRARSASLGRQGRRTAVLSESGLFPGGSRVSSGPPACQSLWKHCALQSVSVQGDMYKITEGRNMGKRRELGLVVGRMAPFGRPRSSPAVPVLLHAVLGAPQGERPWRLRAESGVQSGCRRAVGPEATPGAVDLAIPVSPQTAGRCMCVRVRACVPACARVCWGVRNGHVVSMIAYSGSRLKAG